MVTQKKIMQPLNKITQLLKNYIDSTALVERFGVSRKRDFCVESSSSSAGACLYGQHDLSFPNYVFSIDLDENAYFWWQYIFKLISPGVTGSMEI